MNIDRINFIYVWKCKKIRVNYICKGELKNESRI